MSNTLIESSQIAKHLDQDWHTVDYQALIKAGNVKDWNTWRNQIWASDSDFDINLSGLNLSGVSLVGADLSYVRMVDTNLEGANLRKANLRQALLTGANLTRVNLTASNLEGADLSQVDAQYADLRGSRLTEAPHFTDLTCADFSHANLLDVIWDPDWLKVQGLILDGAELPRG